MTASWRTVGVQRTVLAVARTTTSLNRLLDVLPVFADDSRIQIVFTVDEGSAFSEGVEDHLRAMGARVVGWADAVKTEFDLVLAASDHTDLHELRGPLVLFPHGAGFQKYSPHRRTGTRELSGLTRSALWHDGKPVPARIVLSHGDQLRHLEDVAAELTERAIVAGDPCLDGLLALAQHRETWRTSWGLHPEHTLVTVASTWGDGSALGRRPALPAQLLAELPYDEFRVAAVLHPNVWAHHGRWQVRHWLRRASSAGLILPSPTGAWQAAVASAQCLIGDHGSLSAYASALSIPLMLAAFNADEVPDGSAMAELGTVMPSLDDQRPYAPQIRAAIDGSDAGVLARLADRVFAHRGQSLQLLQHELYDLLALQPPRHPPLPAALTGPPLPVTHPESFQVEAEVLRDEVQLQRFPAAMIDRPPDRRRHLVSTGGEPDARMRENAAVLVETPFRGRDPETWARGTLACHPGCRLVACSPSPDVMLLWLRDGRSFTATIGHRSSAAWDTRLAASALYSLFVRGLPLDVPLRVSAGRTSAVVAFAQSSSDSS